MLAVAEAQHLDVGDLYRPAGRQHIAGGAGQYAVVRAGERAFLDCDVVDEANGVDVDAEVSRMGDPVPPLFWLRDPEGNSLMVVG